MTTLTQMRAQVRYRLLKLRSLEYLVRSYRFEQVWKLIPNVEKLIEDCDLNALRRLIHEELKKDLEDRSVGELRTLASQLGVPYFSKMHKDALIINIKGCL